MKLRVLAVLLAAAVACGACGSPPPPAVEPEPAPLVVDRMPPQPPELQRPPGRPLVEAPRLPPSRDPRPFVTRPRAQQEVAAELDALEKLLAALPKTSAERPQVLRRVAGCGAELARGAGRVEDDARQRAIRAYRTLVDDYPNDASVDEARYFLALEHELAKDKRNARVTYFELIKRHPASKWIPHAYYAFGEMFFEEAATDPSKNNLAIQAFVEALKYPPSKSSVYPDALLRLGQTYERQGDDANALRHYERLRREQPNSDAAARIPAAVAR